MKVVAILLLLAVATYARPPKGGDKGGDQGGDMDKGVMIFMDLVKLCMRLEEEADQSDKKSFDAIFDLFGNVCEGIKNALEKEVGAADMDKRGKGPDMDGPRPTGDPERRPRPAGRRPKDDDKKSMPDMDGPLPTGDPERRPRPDMDGPHPTGDPERRPRPAGNDKRAMGDMSEKPSPEQALLKICFDLAKLGEEMEGKDKRSQDELEEVLKGMEQVCLAAFVEAQAFADQD